MKLIETATAEKLRGGFYTPAPIAHFILRWGMDGLNAPNILEPSCGDGVFLRELSKTRLPYRELTAIEFDPVEAEIAREVPLENKQVINTDFHRFCTNTDERFDLVVGNPPYIRYQYFDEEQQALAKEIFDRAGLKYSKLTNAWVSFVVGASLLLPERGKIGMVVPAELLQVSYALQLREFLSHFYNKINIISFEKLVFPVIQQEVVLLLCERDGTDQHRIDHLELRDASQLAQLDVTALHQPSKKNRL